MTNRGESLQMAQTQKVKWYNAKVSGMWNTSTCKRNTQEMRLDSLGLLVEERALNVMPRNVCLFHLSEKGNDMISPVFQERTTAV